VILIRNYLLGCYQPGTPVGQSVNRPVILIYHEIGRLIVEEYPKGKSQAAYGQIIEKEQDSLNDPYRAAAGAGGPINAESR